jgi:hypothetical protein
VGTLDPELEEEYPVMRVWEKSNFTIPLDDLRYKWTYPDLMKALSSMDMSTSYDLAFEGQAEKDRKKKEVPGGRA